MLAAAASLALWLTDLETISAPMQTTAWAFVDCRLLGEDHDCDCTWIQDAVFLDQFLGL